MGNNKVQIKIDFETHKKLKKLKNLEEFNLERDITFSELIDNMMEKSFEKFDDKIIKQVKH